MHSHHSDQTQHHDEKAVIVHAEELRSHDGPTPQRALTGSDSEGDLAVSSLVKRVSQVIVLALPFGIHRVLAHSRRLSLKLLLSSVKLL